MVITDSRLGPVQFGRLVEKINQPENIKAKTLLKINKIKYSTLEVYILRDTSTLK